MPEILGSDFIHTVTLDGVRTRYLDAGDGRSAPIVLIHGGHFGLFVPISLECWSRNIDDLAQHSRVIAFDKLGQGWTGLPATDEDWTFDAVLDHAKRLFEYLDLSNVTVVGHSRGALLAATLAIDLPDRVSGLVVVSSATLAALESATDTSFYDDIERAVSAETDAASIIGRYHAAQAVAEGPLSAEYLKLAVEMATSPDFAAARATAERTKESYWMPSLARANRRALHYIEESGFTIPVLVVWGHEDRSAPVALGHSLFAELAKNTPCCSMHIVNNAGHQVFRDQPAVFGSAVKSFLDWGSRADRGADRS